LANFAIFAAAPTTLFCIWYLQTGAQDIPREYDLLQLAAPLSASFVLVAPLVFQQGEFVYERLLQSMSRDRESGWNLPLIQRRIDQLDRLYYFMVVPLAVASAVAIGYVFADIGDIAPIAGASAKIGGSVVLCFAGYAAATGMWGAVKAVIIVRTVTTTISPKWSPFRAREDGIHQVFEFAWTMGVLFSISNITVPALLVVMPRLSTPAKVISWSFISITFIGGLLLFVLTSRWLLAAAERKRQYALDQLAPTLEALADRLAEVPQMKATETARLRHGLEAVMIARRHIEDATPAPVSRRTVLAATTTLMVPLAVTVLQTIASKLIT
jgi:hypothetical protein